MRTPFVPGILLAMMVLAGCQPGASLMGTVSAPDGPVEGAEVNILDSLQNSVEAVLTGPGGKFSVRTQLAPGVYVAEVKKAGYQTESQTFSYPEVTTLDLRMKAYLTVKGLVRLQDQSVASRAIVRFKKSSGKTMKKSIADEGGNYSVGELDAGEYTIEVVTPDGLYAIEIPNYKISEKQKIVELEIVLDPAKRSIDTVEGEIQKARVIQDVDAPIEN